MGRISLIICGPWRWEPSMMMAQVKMPSQAMQPATWIYIWQVFFNGRTKSCRPGITWLHPFWVSKIIFTSNYHVLTILWSLDRGSVYWSYFQTFLKLSPLKLWAKSMWLEYLSRELKPRPSWWWLDPVHPKVRKGSESSNETRWNKPRPKLFKCINDVLNVLACWQICFKSFEVLQMLPGWWLTTFR